MVPNSALVSVAGLILSVEVSVASKLALVIQVLAPVTGAQTSVTHLVALVS